MSQTSYSGEMQTYYAGMLMGSGHYIKTGNVHLNNGAPRPGLGLAFCNAARQATHGRDASQIVQITEAENFRGILMHEHRQKNDAGLVVYADKDTIPVVSKGQVVVELDPNVIDLTDVEIDAMIAGIGLYCVATSTDTTRRGTFTSQSTLAQDGGVTLDTTGAVKLVSYVTALRLAIVEVNQP